MNLQGLDKNRLPKHVAIIMDGNGRWAKLRGKSRIEGHRIGKSSVRVVVELSRKLGISYLSLYAFSAENWQRPREEVGALMEILERYLSDEQERMMRNGVRLLAIGERDRLPGSVQRILDYIIEKTKNNTMITVILALSYSGQDDVVKMVRKIAHEVKAGRWEPEDINAEIISAHTETGVIPNPDLLIRTSGEMRISNFFLWQIPYAELYFTPTLWPDFRETQYIQALIEFQRRQRRFGGIDERQL